MQGTFHSKTQNTMKLYTHFMALLALISFNACSEDDNENEMEQIASNTELSVSGEVEGEYKALGSYYKHYESVSEMYVHSFEFMDQYNPAESTFLIGISRFSEEEFELTTGLYPLGTSYMAGGDTNKFGVGVTWWDEDRKATIYPEVSNGILRITQISSERIRGEIILRMKTSEYDEHQAELNIDGKFNVPRDEF